MLRRIHFGCLVVLFVVLVAFGSYLSHSPQVRAQLTPAYEASRDVLPYVPTPMKVVGRMLELAKVNHNDVVYDLGSGDGRIVILAAQKYGARAVGVELDGKRFRDSSARIEELGLASRAKILHQDMFKADIHRATVVMLYLLTSVNEEIRPMLEKQLHPGTRVVSHDFKIKGWKAEKTEHITAKGGSIHTVYLYIRP